MGLREIHYKMELTPIVFFCEIRYNRRFASVGINKTDIIFAQIVYACSWNIFEKKYFFHEQQTNTKTLGVQIDS